MLNYKDIIYKLSVNEKIALLTDFGCLANPNYNQYGIPHTDISYMWQILSDVGEGLSTNIFARTWNPELAQTVIGDALSLGADKEGRFVITPSPKVKLDVYRLAISEDPELCAAFAMSFLRAVHSSGLVGIVDDFSITAGDLDRMDEDVNKRILWEYFIYPFQRTVNGVDGSGVVASVGSAGKGYEKVNFELARKARTEIFKKNISLLCQAQNPNETLFGIKEGAILLKGVASELERAYQNYLLLKTSLEKGEASALELEEAYAQGRAISDDMIDEAVDRVISFAFACQNKAIDKSAPEFDADQSDNLLDVLRQSIVLLKNETDILPLNKDANLAVIGDLALESKFENCIKEELGGNLVGVSRGYDLSGERSEALVAEAVSLASKSDFVLVFLGLERQNISYDMRAKTLSLPANQVALMDSLNEYREKIIGVLVGDLPVDMRFDKYLAGLMLAPLGGALSAKAIIEVLYGKCSPSGKLTESYYDDPEAVLEEFKYYKSTKRNKIGAFFGYRNYDSIGQNIRYPFGYGLSYTNFEYSCLKIKDGKVKFTLKNVGNIRAAEVVQVYLGKTDSAFVRPKKELKAFVRVELDPREKKVVEIDKVDLSIYDDRQGKRVVEGGEYIIYVGNSIQNIKLEERVKVNGERIKLSREKRSDYLQSESNIMENKFTVDKSNKAVKKFMLRKIIGIILLLLALGGYALTFVFAANIIAGILISTALLAFGAFFLATGLIKSNITKKIHKIRMKLLDEQFADAQKVSSNGIENLFVKEFDSADRGKTINKQDPLEDVLYFEKEIDIKTVSEQLLTFFLEKGIDVSSVNITSLVSALATSRLIFTSSEHHGEAINRYFSVLSEYFGTNLYTEEITDAHLAENGMLFINGEDGVDVPTNVMSAVKNGWDCRREVQLVVLNKVKTARVAELLIPYLRYFNNPNRECSIGVKSNEGEYVLPQNLWFVVELDDGELIENIPSYLTEISTVLRVSYFPKDEAEQITEYQKLGYYEFNHLVAKSKNKFDITEDVWKKIDRLEEYVSGNTGYHIGNRLALQTEKYFSVFKDCCKDSEDPLKHTLTAKLLPTMMSVLKDKVDQEEKNLFDVLENLFGEDMAVGCLEALKGVPAQEA